VKHLYTLFWADVLLISEPKITFKAEADPKLKGLA